MDTKDIWSQALSYIRKDTTAVSFNTFIQPAQPIAFHNSVFKIAVPLLLGKQMIENHHRTLIENSISRITGENVKLEVLTGTDIEALKAEHQKTVMSLKNNETSYINPKYTFDKFVVGSSNQYAYNVAAAVAESPGQEYNPLFLYGNSGLGKTHLMLAIGNHIVKNRPDMKVTYVSSEKFTNDMINALRDKSMDEFRRRYRQTDILLIDDIQFIEGKDAIQEEFFHTFNELYNTNRQIVITSDRTPKSLTTLEERLRTRFDWGMTTDIGIPDYETRMAILKNKAENENITIDDEIFNYIAERVNTNVREIEGALKQIVALSKMSSKPIDIKFAEESLKKILPEDKIVKITIKDVNEKVCTYYNVSMEELVGKSRTNDIIIPRQVAMYLCKKLTSTNHVIIGREFGKDRSTVTNNVNKITAELEHNESIRTAVEFITKDLQTI